MAERIATDRRQCPTRPDGSHALIAQSISPLACLERQNSHYHKCFACRYRGLDPSVILPPPPREAREPAPVLVPAVRRAPKKAAKAAKTK